MSLKQKLGLLFVFILSMGFVSTYYFEVVKSPNEYMFSQGGDGIKNYYSVYNHVKNDEGLMYSNSVNYPNGELILYMDGQFAVSNTIKLISYVFPSIANYSVGIMNLLMLFSIVLSALFVYLILIQYKVDEIIAAIGSLGIMMMQPQIFRMFGHFALSYAFVIPLSWWAYEKFREKGSYKWLGFLLFTNLTLFFIHPYFGLIVTIFELLIVFNQWVFSKSKAVDFWLSLLQIVLLMLPLILFKVTVGLADGHIGRSNNPYGLYEYQAAIDTVFVPILRPIKPLLLEWLGYFHQTWEGWAYIGLANVFGVFLILWFFIFRKSRERVINNQEWSKFAPVFVSGWLVLLFSMGIPFEIFDGILVDILPVFKQFRALGRFAWVFYYVSGITTILMIQYMVISKGKKYLWIALFALVMIVEGFPYHQNTVNGLTQNKNTFNETYTSSELADLIKHVPNRDFQAMFPLPFYMEGSEEVSISGSQKSAMVSMTLSAKLGLPIIGGKLSRTSIPETKEAIALLSPAYYSKEIISKFDMNKPILVVYTGEELSVEQLGILERSQLIYKSEYGSLLSILPSDFYHCPEDSLMNLERSFPNYEFRNNVWASDSTSYIFYESYDSFSATKHLLGEGALELSKDWYKNLAEFKPGTYKKDTDYELTLWYYTQDSSRVFQTIGVHAFGIDGENLGWIKSTNIKNCETIFGEWSLFRLKFRIDRPENVVKIVTAGDEKKTRVFYDNLLVRELTTDVIQKTVMNGDSVLVLNNDIISFCKDK